jgi:hypothetical protein
MAWSRPRSLIGIALLGCACAVPDVPNATLDGSYALTAFNGHALPDSLFPLPDHNAQPTSCWYVLSAGQLDLTAGDSSFKYNTVYRNSCDQSILSNAEVAGHFLQVGELLQFRTPGQSGDRFFGGTLQGPTIIVQAEPDERFDFAKVQ